MTNWINILKQEKPRFSAFFKENDIAEFIKEAKRKEDKDIHKYGTYGDQVRKLTDKYGISSSASELIMSSHNKGWSDYYETTPIVDIDSYNRALRKKIEVRQKRKLKERNKHPPRKKGQRRR